MEEREQHKPNPNNLHHYSVPVVITTNGEEEETSARFESGTYVVQVPKDQIYRVPPPENAMIAQRHLTPDKNRPRTSCSCFLCCFLFVTLVLLLAGVAATFSAIFTAPKDPKFSLQRFHVKNQTFQNNLEYDITIQVENRDKYSGILYKQDGVASLSFGHDQHEIIASGRYPSFYQAHENSTNLHIILKAAEPDKEIDDKSLKSDHVPLSFRINTFVNMKSWIFFNAGDFNIVVTCDFVVDSLAEDSRIVSQQCQTKRK